MSTGMKDVGNLIEPELSIWRVPAWFHPHGRKMLARKTEAGRRCVSIASNAASLFISPAPTGNDWMVEWHIIHSQNENTSGRALFTTDELVAAFGVLQKTFESGDQLISRFGGHSACQGKYIMWMREEFCYLNIPAPGTGRDGDPNISIEVDLVTRDEVCRLFQ